MLERLGEAMLDVRKQIKKIEDLLDQNSIGPITYAALEARLAIEMVCYERLRISYGCISYADLRRWQPKAIVEQVVKEANDLAAANVKLSISKTPVNQADPPRSVGDYEALEYELIGTQAEIDLKNIGSLWQALSSVALHVRVPRDINDSLSIYGDEETIKQKVNEALGILRKFGDGSLLFSGLREEISWECHGCGENLRRKVSLIYPGMVASCPREDCNESYEMSFVECSLQLRRRVEPFPCSKCGANIDLPARLVERLRRDAPIVTKCHVCDERHELALIPVFQASSRVSEK